MPSPNASSAKPASRLERRLACAWTALGLYLLLAAALTFPLVLHFSSSLPAGSGDIRQNYWNLWWWKTALLELHQSPYRTEFLFHPAGTDLVFHTHSPFNMLVSLPVNVLWGEAAAYNFCILLALALSGFTAYLLARELTGDARAGFLAGLVYAFFPQHLDQSFEHLNLVSVQFLPLALLFWFRLIRRGRMRDALALGLSFAANALCSWHLGVKLLLVLAVLGAAEIIRGRGLPWDLAKKLSAAAAVAALVVGPFVTPLIAEIAAGETYYQKRPVSRGIDAAYLLAPPPHHPLWGGWAAEAYGERAYGAAGSMCYIGFFPLLLAAAAVFKRAPRAGAWALFGLAALVLSLGANPFWRGELVESVTLPFAVFEHIPLLSTQRVANRFLILTSLALAVLAALAWPALRRRTDARFLLFAGVIVLEYLWLPYPTHPVRISPGYRLIREAPGAGAVLDIPFHQRSRSGHNLIAQTVHRKPIAGGYVSAYPPEPLKLLENDPVLSRLAAVPKAEPPVDWAHLTDLGFEWAVLHNQRRGSFQEAAASRLRGAGFYERKRVRRLGGVPDAVMDRIAADLEHFAGPPLYEDERITIFRFEPRPAASRTAPNPAKAQ